MRTAAQVETGVTIRRPHRGHSSQGRA